MSISHQATFSASPDRLFKLLTDGEEFAAATGKAASMVAREGADFSLFGGFLQGRQIELVPGQRIVQAWRNLNWEPGQFSIVRFTLSPHDQGALLTLNHEAYPVGPSPIYPTWHEHLATNWPVFYFNPIAKYLAAEGS